MSRRSRRKTRHNITLWRYQIELMNDREALDALKAWFQAHVSAALCSKLMDLCDHHAILQSLSGRLHRKHPLLKHAVTKYYDIAARWYAAVSLMSLNAFTGERHLIFSKDKP